MLAEPPQLTLETIFHPDQKVDFDGPDLPQTRWLVDGGLAIRDGDAWKRLTPETGAFEEWLLPKKIGDALRQLEGVKEQEISEAQKQLGQSSKDEQRWLLRVGGGWVWFDAETNDCQLVQPKASEWHLATLSPDGKLVGYVQKNDLFVHDLASDTSRVIARDDRAEILIGKLDWIYQEEVYGRGNYRAFWFSPDSKQIAYLILDESKAPRWSLDDLSKRDQSLESEYYPRSGEPLPRVSLWVSSCDAESPSRVVDEPSEDEPERLIVRVTWKSDHELSYQIQDRRQKWLELKLYDLTHGKGQRLIREESGAWQEPLMEPRWMSDGSFIWLSDRANGRRHLYRVFPQTEDGSPRVDALTEGEWDVWEVDEVSPDHGAAIVTGAAQPGQRSLYRVPLDQPGAALKLTETPGTHRATVRSDAQWLVDSFSSAGKPPSLWLLSGTTPTKNEHPESLNGEQDLVSVPVRRLHEDHRTAWADMQRDPPSFEQVRLDDGAELPIQVFSPHGINLNESKHRYPVLLHTYAGPMAPAAVDRWQGANGLWHQMLADEGIVVVLVDPRSSAGNGPRDCWPIYGRLGESELRDISAICDQLARRPWFDRLRVGLWGWSYGGYFTSYALTHSERFCCGIAGAPVTDWHNYDAIYTERLMNLPQDNGHGYKESSVVEAAASLKAPLLMIHGGMDDNVHPTNTWQLVHAAMNAQAPIESLFFPTARHSVSDPAQRYWMYGRMTEFLRRHLKPNTDSP